MDDFTKKDKYQSIHSAIKDIVSQNNNLYQKALAERYGLTKPENIEEARRGKIDYKKILQDLIDEGIFEEEEIISAFMKYMSESDFKKFLTKAKLMGTVEHWLEMNEAKMEDSEVLAAAKKLAENGKDEKAKSFGKGLVDFYEKNKSFTPDQVAGLQNIMKNASFQMAKEEVELDEASYQQYRVTFKTPHDPVEVKGRTPAEAIKTAQKMAEKQKGPKSGLANYKDVFVITNGKAKKIGG